MQVHKYDVTAMILWVQNVKTIGLRKDWTLMVLVLSQLYGLISPNADLDGCGSLQSLLHPVNLVFSFLEVLNTGLTVYSISGGNLTSISCYTTALFPGHHQIQHRCSHVGMSLSNHIVQILSSFSDCLCNILGKVINSSHSRTQCFTKRAPHCGIPSRSVFIVVALGQGTIIMAVILWQFTCKSWHSVFIVVALGQGNIVTTLSLWQFTCSHDTDMVV